MVQKRSLTPAFQRLSLIVQLHEPSSLIVQLHEPSIPSTDAPLIIHCKWMNAPTKLINEYSIDLITHYPSSSILLIAVSWSDFMLAGHITITCLIQPAVDTILRHTQLSEAPRFGAEYSNGGTQSLVRLALPTVNEQANPSPSRTSCWIPPLDQMT